MRISAQWQNYFNVASILALAFILRLWGVDFGLPALYHADEPIVVHHALAYGTGDLNPHFFKIPPLISYLLFGFYGVYFLLGRMTGFFPDLQVFENLFYEDPSSFYLIARIIFGVIAGTGTVFLFGRFIKRHFGDARSVLGMFLFAVCFLHVRDSHYVYVDIPLVLVLVCFLHSFYRRWGQPFRSMDAVHVGFWLGLAGAVKYNGVFFGFAYAAYLFITQGRKAWRFLTISAAVSFAFFILFNPFALFDWRYFLEEIRAQSQAHGGAPDWLLPLNFSLRGGVGLPVLFFSALGMISSVWNKDLKRIPLLILFLCYYVIIVYFGQPYERYVLPLIPMVLFFASDAAIYLCERIKPVRLASAAFIFIILLLGFPNFAKSILFNRLMVRPDTRDLAREWILQNIPHGSRIALDGSFYMPRLSLQSDLLEEKMDAAKSSKILSHAKIRRLSYLLNRAKTEVEPSYRLFFLLREGETSDFLFSSPTAAYDIVELKALKIDYVVTVRLQEKELLAPFYQRLDAEGVRLVHFNPYCRQSREWPYMHPLTGGPFLWRDLIDRLRNGQPLTIYRLSDTSA